jgi:hypothetical protein
MADLRKQACSGDHDRSRSPPLAVIVTSLARGGVGVSPIRVPEVEILQDLARSCWRDLVGRTYTAFAARTLYQDMSGTLRGVPEIVAVMIGGSNHGGQIRTRRAARWAVRATVGSGFTRPVALVCPPVVRGGLHCLMSRGV